MAAAQDSPAQHGLRIVFVCSGNLCRSPMAEALARRLAASKNLTIDWIESAGTLGIEGETVPELVERVLAPLGLSLAQHRSRTLSVRHLDEADFIVVMAPQHAREVRMRRPGAADRIVRLWKYTSKPGRLKEIADPIGGDLAVYRRCRDNLEECLTNWLTTLAKDDPSLRNQTRDGNSSAGTGT